VKGEGTDTGAVYFLPPGDGTSTNSIRDDLDSTSAGANSNAAHEGDWNCTGCDQSNAGREKIDQCTEWRGGTRIMKPYLSNVRDVIERVLKSSDGAEAKAAEAYTKVVPDIQDQFDSKKNEPVQPESEHIEQDHVELDWKNKRTHYPKASSRVGDEYQVAELPAAGTYSKGSNELYDDQVWDWRKAEASGKLSFCERIAPNKKSEAYEKLYQRGFKLPGFYREVCDIPTTDGSDWTEEERMRFRASIFKEQKSIIKVSRAIGKPMTECMTYYYGTFKKSKDYPRLKLAIYRHKEKAVKTRSSNWICDVCGVGGKLIACDECDAHYHLTCVEPPLKEVPEGSWICGRCSTAKAEASAVVKCRKEAVGSEVDSISKLAANEAITSEAKIPSEPDSSAKMESEASVDNHLTNLRRIDSDMYEIS